MSESGTELKFHRFPIEPDPELRAALEHLCSESNKLHNAAIAYAQQVWNDSGECVSSLDLASKMRSNSPHFWSVDHGVAAQTCLSVWAKVKAFSNKLALLKKAESFGEFWDEEPSFPGPCELNEFACPYPARRLRLTEGNYIELPLGEEIQAKFGLDVFYVPLPDFLYFKDLDGVRILNENGQLYAQCAYFGY